MIDLYKLAQAANPIPKGWMQWLTEDTLGKMVGIGLLVVVALAALYVVFLTVNTLRVHAKKLIVAAAIIGGGVWAVQFFQPSGMTWFIIGFMAFGALVGYALMLTHAK
ncbi:MAG: hypothetical protein GC159_03035 [Phycisphaera sp.]|nr:hypothetical protein [Phycisphaera sp.]